MSASVHDASAAAARPAVAAGATPPTRRAEGRSRRDGWLRIVSPIALVLLWQLLSATGVLPPSKLVSPTTVVHEGWTLITTNNPSYGTLQYSLAVSAERWGIGFSIGTVAAIILAVATGLSRIAEYVVDPIVQVLRSIPLLGILPLFIVWFGIGELPKILIVLLGALFPMYVNTYAEIRGIDPKLGEAARTLGLSWWGRIRHIVLPGGLPGALSGIRLGSFASLLALVVAEQFNTNAGLGFMITQAESFLQNSIIVLVLVVYAILGLLANGIVRLIERKALAWRRDFAR
ncbi:MAG: ABC transporter permease [Streptosporangiales bacterium]|nr:ABC transporter permease [Streptosporangiales bacterium]